MGETTPAATGVECGNSQRSERAVCEDEDNTGAAGPPGFVGPAGAGSECGAEKGLGHQESEAKGTMALLDAPQRHADGAGPSRAAALSGPLDQKVLSEVYPGLPPFISPPDPDTKRRIDIMLRSSPCGLIVTSNCNGLYSGDFPILYVNKIFEFMTGYSAGEILGRDCRFLQFRGMYASSAHESVDRETVRSMRAAIAAGQEFRGEIVNFRKDGSPLINALYIAPIRGDTADPDRVTHFVGIQNFRPADHLKLSPLERESETSLRTRKAKGTLALPRPGRVEEPAGTEQPEADHGVGTGSATGSDEETEVVATTAVTAGGGDDTPMRTAADLHGSVPSTSQRCSVGAEGSKRRRTTWFDDADGSGHLNQRQAAPPAVDVNGVLDSLHDEVWTSILGRLSPYDLANVGLTCRRFRSLTKQDMLWHQALQNVLGEVETREIWMTSGRTTWNKLAGDIIGLDNARWRPFGVGGRIIPERTNFALCAMGSKIILFGGEGRNSEALNDLFVLDFLSQNPCWRRVEGRNPPQGRWGHTFDRLCENWIVMFGGGNSDGLLNECMLLEISESDQYQWHSVNAMNPPTPRSWHTSTVVNDFKLVIFGGCDASGNLLCDTTVLDFGSVIPVWREIPVEWKPPSRLGHSLCVIEGSLLFMFGGFATAGSVRLRTADAFTINIDDENPSWRYLSGSVLPSGSISLGNVPSPRLQHVAIRLWNGVICVLGGSTSELDETQHASTQVFMIRPQDEKPMWEILDVKGMRPREAWGYSACRVGSSILLPYQSVINGTLSANDFYALSFSNSEGADEAEKDAGCVGVDGQKDDQEFGKYENQLFWLESNTRKSRHGGKETDLRRLSNRINSASDGGAGAIGRKDQGKIGTADGAQGNNVVSSDDPSTDAQLLQLQAQDAEISPGSGSGGSGSGSGSDDSVNSPNYDQLPLYVKTLVSSHFNAGGAARDHSPPTENMGGR